MKKILTITLVLVALLIGCEQSTLTPAASTNIDTAITTVESVGQITSMLGVLMPALLPIGALILGIAGTVKKLKPKLQLANTNAQMSAAVIHDIVAAIEEFKVKNPTEWIALKIKLGSKLSPITKKVINDNK